MHNRTIISLIFAAVFVLLPSAATRAADPDFLSLQNKLTGATAANRAKAADGAGITVGVLDTGVAADWIGFNGTVDTANSVCIFAGCDNALALIDDEGHGTFVASEIAAQLSSYGLTGVAPATKILSVKVLDASGAGYSSDLARGIAYAADHGANVLNLSLGPSGSPAQEAAFYKSIAAAVNYAAARNVVLVFAGGNSAKALASAQKIAGFSDAALSRMFFTGSTTAKKTKSTFSNTPGTAGFISSSGKFYSLRSMWLTADGENIWGASNYSDPLYGTAYITQASGTSMTAPQGAGAAALLAARWPFLLSRGTIAKILESSAQDLGKKGVDTVYGAGFLRLDKAMQPVGALRVPAKTKMVPVTGTGIVSGGATGALSGLSKALARAVGYDSFMRGFPIYSAGLVTTQAAQDSISPATAATTGNTPADKRSLRELGDGNWLAFSGAAGGNAADDNPDDWSFGLQQGRYYFGAGMGSGAPLLLNDARWGQQSAFSGSASGATGNVLGLVNDAAFSFFAYDLGKTARFSVGVLKSQNDPLAASADSPSAESAMLAYTFSPGARLKISTTATLLAEKNALLGTQSSGYLALGDATSASFGLGADANLGGGYRLGLDAAAVKTRVVAGASSIVSDVSGLTSASAALVLSKKDFAARDDSFSVEIKKPLRLYAGQAVLDVPVDTDSNGNPVIERARVGLTPSGNETDLNFNYSQPLDSGMTGSFSLSARQDADNIRGARDIASMFRLRARF